ncbi:hypothetical protein [Thermomonas sp.]|uniref:hypothetical protein n=1 Tax=Thermomonas sp. TaxID=1971895 RepID=UPI0035B19754
MAKKETRGAKPLAPVTLQGDVMDGEALAERSQQLATAAEVKAAYGADRDLINQLLGQAQMAQAFGKFADVSAVSKIASVKESGIYKGLAGMLGADGQQLAGTWAEFCGLLGRSHQQVDEDIRNLRALGSEALEAMGRMGIGYRELRQYRQLSADDQTALAEVAKTGDKEAVLDLAEELISRQRNENEKLAGQLEKKVAEYDSLSERQAKLTEDLDKAKAKAALLPRMKADKKADHMLAELETAFAEARTALRNVAQGAARFLEYAADNGLDFDEDVSARTVELDNMLLALVMDLRLRGINQPHENALVVLGGA